VGDGIVGMTAALTAAQGGLRVALIAAAHSEAKPTPAWEPWDRRVYALSPGSRSFLEKLRVWSQLEADRIAPIREMRVFGDVRGAEVRFSAYEAGTEALAWIVESRELERVLKTALAYQQNIERVEADAEDFQVDGQGVSVTTARGALRALLLVAADGARSRIRELAGINGEMRSYEQVAVVANFSGGRPPGDIARQWFVREGVVALLPLPHLGLSLVWSAPSRIAASLLEQEPIDLARRVEAVTGGEVGPLQPLGGASGFPLRVLRTRRQSGPRVVLIGDAAHVVHPLAGQGLNLGLQDAESLVDILIARESFRDCGDALLLRRYERARSEAVWAMRSMTHGLHHLFTSADPNLERLRSTGMKLVERLPVLKRALVRSAMGRSTSV
jgi:ubiquinone biosynthesis UbiH/UbiF/VisC/COQ6 family hydroxylase